MSTSRLGARHIPRRLGDGAAGAAARYTDTLALFDSRFATDHDGRGLLQPLTDEQNEDATQYFSWLAAADLYDPAEVIDGTVHVDWKNERAERLFALVQAVTTLGLSGNREMWRKAALVLAGYAELQKPDVALPSAQKLANNMP